MHSDEQSALSSVALVISKTPRLGEQIRQLLATKNYKCTLINVGTGFKKEEFLNKLSTTGCQLILAQDRMSPYSAIEVMMDLSFHTNPSRFRRRLFGPHLHLGPKKCIPSPGRPMLPGTRPGRDPRRTRKEDRGCLDPGGETSGFSADPNKPSREDPRTTGGFRGRRGVS